MMMMLQLNEVVILFACIDFLGEICTLLVKYYTSSLSEVIIL